MAYSHRPRLLDKVNRGIALSRACEETMTGRVRQLCLNFGDVSQAFAPCVHDEQQVYPSIAYNVLYGPLLLSIETVLESFSCSEL